MGDLVGDLVRSDLFQMGQRGMIDFDHASAAAVLPEIKSIYSELLEKYSGNYEAAHGRGHQLKKAAQMFENKLFEAVLPQAPLYSRGAFFADSATTLINAAGMIFNNAKSLALTSGFDHPAAEKMLQRSFGKVKIMSFDGAGIINGLPELEQEVGFIYLTLLQSEIGTLQDIAELMPQLRKKYPDAFIFADAVQFVKHYEYQRDFALPDALLVSGSKLGAGSGAALLVCGKKFHNFKTAFENLRKNEHLLPRCDLVQTAALTECAKLVKKTRAFELENVSEINRYLRCKLENMLLPNGKRVILTVPENKASADILHLILPGYQSGVLVRMFSAKDILLSAGSACAAESSEPSKVLLLLGYSKSDAYSGLRLSFGKNNTLAEADIFINVLQELLRNY